MFVRFWRTGMLSRELEKVGLSPEQAGQALNRLHVLQDEEIFWEAEELIISLQTELEHSWEQNEALEGGVMQCPLTDSEATSPPLSPGGGWSWTPPRSPDVGVPDRGTVPPRIPANGLVNISWFAGFSMVSFEHKCLTVRASQLIGGSCAVQKAPGGLPSKSYINIVEMDFMALSWDIFGRFLWLIWNIFKRLVGQVFGGKTHEQVYKAFQPITIYTKSFCWSGCRIQIAHHFQSTLKLEYSLI